MKAGKGTGSAVNAGLRFAKDGLLRGPASGLHSGERCDGQAAIAALPSASAAGRSHRDPACGADPAQTERPAVWTR